MIEVLDGGVIDYGVAWKEQQHHFDALLIEAKDGESKEERNKRGVLMLCEHPHVYTLGKSGEMGNLLVSPEFLKSIGASYYHTDRGGDITYHGYGQLVGYPILDLSTLCCGDSGQRGLGLKEYVHLLEQCVIDTIEEWGVKGQRRDDATGVWLEALYDEVTGEMLKPERKICAIGVKASRFVTMHGFALNVTTDLKYFSYINPCGFIDKGVTSMAAEVDSRDLSDALTMYEVKRVFVRHFKRVFEPAQKA